MPAPPPEPSACSPTSRPTSGAGMFAIGFAGEITPPDQLAAADVVVTDMAELSGAVRDLLC